MLITLSCRSSFYDAPHCAILRCVAPSCAVCAVLLQIAPRCATSGAKDILTLKGYSRKDTKKVLWVFLAIDFFRASREKFDAHAVVRLFSSTVQENEQQHKQTLFVSYCPV